MASPAPWSGKAEIYGSPHNTHDPLLCGRRQLVGSDTRDSSGRSRCNKQKCRINGDNAEDTAVNAGFRGSKSGQQKKPFKRNPRGPSSLDRILDRLCQIHGTPERPANHTNRDCWVFKQAGKLCAENKDKGLHSDDEEEPRLPNNSGQKSKQQTCYT